MKRAFKATCALCGKVGVEAGNPFGIAFWRPVRIITPYGEQIYMLCEECLDREDEFLESKVGPFNKVLR